MATIVRLELRNECPEMDDGLQARIHDPLWLLARQWQFGEFKGDDAGSPAAAQLVVTSAPVARYHAGPVPADPDGMQERTTDYAVQQVPLETLVEREPVRDDRANDFRLAAEAGLQFVRMLEAHAKGTYRDLFRGASPLAAPSEDERATLDGDTLRFLQVVAGRVIDGARLYARLKPLGQSGRLKELFDVPPFDGVLEADRPGVIDAVTAWTAWYDGLFSAATGNDSWIHDRLEYAFAVSGQTSAGEMVLSAPEYLEGHLDWFSFVAARGLSLGTSDPVASTTARVLPVPVSFRGMPSSRLWEFEDGRVNFGRVEADPQDLARLLLVEFALVYGNDWFVVPVEVEVGALCRIGSLMVTNTFGERMLIDHTTAVDGAGSPWRMFGLSPDPRSLGFDVETPDPLGKFQDVFFLPPVLGQSLEGPPVEDVLLQRDEMANMAWAVECVVQSRTGSPLDRSESLQERRRRQESAPTGDGAGAERPAPAASLVYRLGTTVPDYWIPLLPVQDGSGIRLRRGTLPRTESENVADVFELQGIILDPGHDLRLHDEEVPREGARVTRSFQYARWSDGSTHLWIGRRKQPGRGEGSSGLRFDVVEPAKA
jgi:hypothetical protein